MAASGPIYTANSPIPVDLFVSKKYPGLTRGDIGFADSSGGIIYRVNRTQHQSKSNSSQRRKRVVVVDSAGNPLISVYRQDKGLWQGFKGDDGEEKELIFKVNRTMKTLTRTEFEVFIVDENSEDSASHFTIKGSPFQKSCTIYRGNSIIAQALEWIESTKALLQMHVMLEDILRGVPEVKRMVNKSETSGLKSNVMKRRCNRGQKAHI